MAQVTRTTNPIHFEDLEPHRFEDLIRQLAYEFKPWRKLEATGRGGSDDGFDARGYEIVRSPDDDESDESVPEPEHVQKDDGRVWLIQCKREQTIGPKKLKEYITAIPRRERDGLYGVVFAAACDFTKKARDAFDATCRECGFSEWHLWGKAELEDMLFQPKNDHLLFAYFNLSLTIRRRSVRSEVRARLAMKRKAHRLLQEQVHQWVLLRDPRADKYPYAGEVPDFSFRPPWRIHAFDAFVHDGLRFKIRRSCAYIGDDGKSWDVAPVYNHEIYHIDDPWAQDNASSASMRAAILSVWGNLPEKNKAWFESWGVVLYDEIVDIDEHGDEWTEYPHVYVPFEHDGRPFKYAWGTITNVPQDQADRIELRPNSPTEDRIVFFPKEYRQFPGEATG